MRRRVLTSVCDDEHVKELSVRMSLEKDVDKDDKKLDLVLGELV